MLRLADLVPQGAIDEEVDRRGPLPCVGPDPHLATLARYEAVGRTPLNDEVRWRKVGLAFPTTWWPTDAPGVALALIDGPDGPLLQLTPDAHGHHRLHRNRRSWELRMPSLVQVAVADAAVARTEGGVLLGSLSEEGAAEVKRWLGGGATEEA
jgi:hypothetical protein